MIRLMSEGLSAFKFVKGLLHAQVAVARLRRLPRLEGFPVAAVPCSPYPNDSDLYNTLRCPPRSDRAALRVVLGH